MNKNARKLIPAVAMLLVSASMLSTASYAWFSMNNKVTAGGMNVNVVTPGDLMISTTTDFSAKKSSETLTEANPKTVVPVSSVNGTDDSFYYATTKGVQEAGTITDETEIKKLETDFTNLKADYGTTVIGYVDYTFYVQSSANVDKEIIYSVADTKVIYTGTGSNSTENAFRWTIFVAETTASSATANNVSPLMSNERSTDKTKAWNATKASGTAGTAVGTMSYYTNDAVIWTAISTKTYQVKVRIWLDGEDPLTTTSNFASLTSDYSLTVALAIKE